LAGYGSVNTAWVWVESDSAFEAIATTDTGTGISSVNNSGFANIKVGNAVTTGTTTIGGVLTVTGDAILTTGNIGGLQAKAIGNVTPGTGVFVSVQATAIGNVTPGTAVFTTANAVSIQATAIGNITPGTGAFTTLSTTANLTVGGNIAVTGNIVPSANVTYSLGTLNNRFKDLFLSGSTIYAGGYTISEEASGNVNITTNSGNRLQVLGTAANAVQATGNIVAPFHLGSLVGSTATITTSANITGTGASTTSTTGALVVMGGAGVAGQIYAGGIQNTPIGGTTASTAVFTTASTGGLQAVAIGNVTPGTAAFTTATTGGLQAVAIGNVTPGTAAFTTATTGGLQAVAIGNATPGTAAFTTATTGGLQAQAIGNVTPGTGFFTTANATNVYAATIGNVGTSLNGTGTNITALTATNVNGTVATANVSLYNSFTSTSTNTTFYPQLVDKTSGNGAGFATTTLSHNPSTGTLTATYFNGTLLGTVSAANVAYYENITPLSNNQTYYLPFANVTTGNSTLGAVTAVNVNPSTGSIFSTSANTTTLNAGGTVDIAGVTKITSATTATSTATGALQVTGGAGIGGNLYVGGISTLTGNVTIGGNLTVSGQSVSIGASTLSIVDPIISLNTPADLSPLTSVTTADIGLKFHYYDTSDQHAFLGRTVADGYLTWYARGNDTANVFTGTVLGTTKSGAAIIANARVVGGGLSANTGALQVWGDGSVSGNLFVGGTFVTASINGTPIGNATPSTGVFTTLNATGVTASTVSAVTIGNIGAKITGDAGFLSNVIAANIVGAVPTANVSMYANVTYLTNNQEYAVVFSNIGTATATGGNTILGVQGWDGGIAYNPSLARLTIGTVAATTVTAATISTTSTTISGGNIVAASSAVSTSTTTGSFIAKGGVGVAGSVYIGGSVNAPTIGNIGANVVGTGTYLTSLTATNVNGTVATANVSLYDNISNYTNNQTFYLQFSNVTAGNTATGAVSSVNVNPSTGNVYATAFVGSGLYLTGVATAGAGNVSYYANVSNYTNNQTYYLTYGNVVTGNTQLAAATTVNVNPSTGTLSATTFSGAISSSMVTTALGFTPYNNTNPSGYQTASGSVANATNATNAYITAQTGSTIYYPTFVASTTSGQQGVNVDGNGYLQYNPGTNTLSSNILVLTYGANINSGQNTGVGSDLYVSGKRDKTLIWARPNATYDSVIIGNSAISANVVSGAKLNINTTDSILLPVGTTAQRPGAVGYTDTTGMLRYSTTNGTIEWYNGTQWQTASTQFTVIADQQFSGTGSQTAFTLSSAQTTASCIVSINGVVQIPTLAYSVSSTTLTFTEAPANGEVIDVRQLTTTQNVTSLASLNGLMQISADNNGVYINTGTSSTTVTTYWTTAGAQVNSIANTAVASANTATTVDTMSTSTYRSAKYVVQATNGANYQVMEALLISDGTTATVMSYGTVQTGANVGVLTATQSGSNALLQFVSFGTNTNVRVTKDYIII
jgi:hypothetical protein